MDTTAAARHAMHDGQLRPNHITSPAVLAAFLATPRHAFTPTPVQAYADAPLQMAPGRFMPAPMVTARLVQELNIRPQQAVLVLAGGTGYAAAILTALGAKVTLVEADATLRAQAPAGVTAVASLPAGQTFDAILSESPTPRARWSEALNIGGIAAVLEEGPQGLLKGRTLTKQANHTLVAQDLLDTHLPHTQPPPSFTF